MQQQLPTQTTVATQQHSKKYCKITTNKKIQYIFFSYLNLLKNRNIKCLYIQINFLSFKKIIISLFRVCSKRYCIIIFKEYKISFDLQAFVYHILLFFVINVQYCEL